MVDMKAAVRLMQEGKRMRRPSWTKEGYACMHPSDRGDDGAILTYIGTELESLRFTAEDVLADDWVEVTS